MTDTTTNADDRFVTDKVTCPPIKVDCSDWVDASDGWTFGDFVTEKVTREPVVIDCSRWDAEAAESSLAVSVQFEDGELTDTFVRSLRQTAPAMSLERATPEAATVVVALRNHSAVAALYDAFQGLQTAGCVIGSEANGFRVRRKAS